MNKAVYTEMLKTFGRKPGQWVGLLAELMRTMLLRVYVVVVMAQAASHLASGDFHQAKQSVLYFLVAYITGLLIGVAGDLISIQSENREYNRLLVIYHQKLTGKDMAFYRDNQTGYLASVFRQYLDSILLLVRLLRGDIIRTVISLVAPAIVLAFADLALGVVAFGIIVIQLVYVFWSSAKANKYRTKSHEIYRKITAEVSDHITNIVAFKSGGKEESAHQRMKDLAEEEISAFWLRRKTTTLLDLPRGIITAIGISFAFYIVVNRSATNPALVGLMVLTLTYMFQITRNVMDLPLLIYQHDDLVTKLYPTLEYNSSKYEEIKDIDQPQPFVVNGGEILLRDVTFAYPSGNEGSQPTTVFKNLTIHIQGGEQVGIVGLSGAGKSTLASLLMRFDDISSGVITIDGQDITQVKQSDLRRSIAYVPQEPLLFHLSVKENVSYFNPEASEQDIVKAAKAAHAHEFISELPDGYNTTVGERGVKLSGGQKQRIAIARAVLKNAPIILFDEATSALDSESEKIIQNALPDIIGKHTALVIAHRLSTVAALDRIIVLHKGAVVEEGSHAQLLRKKGRYYSLWQKQTKQES